MTKGRWLSWFVVALVAAGAAAEAQDLLRVVPLVRDDAVLVSSSSRMPTTMMCAKRSRPAC